MPDAGIELRSPTLQADSLPSEPPRNPLFSIVTTQIPPTMSKGFLYSTSSPTFICRLSDDSHSDRYEVLLHCGFDLYCSDDQQC